MLYVYEDGDKGWKVECEVEAKVIPHVPARTNCSNDDASPPEGGYLEDVTFHITGMWVDVCGVPVGLQLPEAARELLESQIAKEYSEDSLMRDEIWEEYNK